MNISKVSDGIYHIHSGDKNASMLYRYKILSPDTCLEPDDNCVYSDDKITLLTKCGKTEFIYTPQSKGYIISIGLGEDERLFGTGDATRENLMIRGMKINIRIDDFDSYGPMPIMLSSYGWGLLVNSTYTSVFDCGCNNKDTAKITVTGGEFDIYLFKADTLKALISKLTSVTGRAAVLPKFAYGLSFVENEQIDTRGMLWDIKTLRNRNIPCDVIGLEPNWMETSYDYTLDKKWNKEQFYLPVWEDANTSSDFTFFYPMRKMGMNLSLWLCNDYDLFYAEDKNFEEEAPKNTSTHDGIVDPNLRFNVKMDKITDTTVPWFEHLKKFVDNGAAAFKLDGAKQILYHRDRLWGGKYLDDEVHNVYPVIYAKQMTEGFAEYTGRRLFLYTAGAYVGIQKYAATWAGDTGGGEKTVLSLMTHAMCGHSNTTCDLEVKDPYAIHYGFLTPWSQYFCWANWKYPWFMGDETEELIRFYANLRSSLVPYIYTMAHIAYSTGISILRPLPLMYEDTDRFDNVKNAYMLGDKLYVGVFDMNLKLPQGKWVDYWNGDIYEGDICYSIPKGRAGALFVKMGSVFVTMKPQKYILEKEHDYIVNVYPGGDDMFTLIEDDGYTYDYQSGGICTTDILMKNTNDAGFELTVCARKGSFEGRPDNGSDIASNSIPKIAPCGEVRDMEIKIHGKKPASIECMGSHINFDYADNTAMFIIDAKNHSKGDVTYKITY